MRVNKEARVAVVFFSRKCDILSQSSVTDDNTHANKASLRTNGES